MAMTIADYEQNGSDAEKALIEACREGKACRLGTLPPEAGEAPTVRAELIRCLALEETSLHEAGVWLEGARITGVLDVRFAKCRGRLLLEKCRFSAKPLMEQADLAQLSLSDSNFPGIFAQGINLTGDLFLRRVVATESLEISGARIHGQFTCEDAKMDGNKRKSLNAQGTEVTGSFFLRNVVATGTIDLGGAKIGGQFDCEGATLDGDRGEALNCQSLRVDQGFYFRKVLSIKGRVVLAAAQMNELTDDAASWAKCSNLILDGFAYNQIDGDTSPKAFTLRRDWLEKGSRFKDEFYPQPYTQFAKVMRASGHLGEARKTLMERDTILFREAEKADQKLLDEAWGSSDAKRGDCGRIWLRLQGRRFWAGLSRRVIGHGHKPDRALFWAVGFWGFGALVYFWAYRFGLMVPNSDVIMVSADWLAAVKANAGAPTEAWTQDSVLASKHYESFFAAIYALDLFLPLVDLGQESTWAVTTPTTFGWGWWLRVGTLLYQIAGWVIVSLGIAAVTGFVQRNDPE